jgi:hypothetical protein
VRHGIGFEQLAFARQRRLELVEQPRLSGARLSHHGDKLPLPGSRAFKRALHLLKLEIAADELRQPAPRGKLEMPTERPSPTTS